MDYPNDCSLRKEGVAFDPKKAYGKSTTRFTLELHHGGFFTMGSGRRYMNGKVSWYDGVDIDLFSVIELKDMFGKLGYKEEDTMYFHFRIPNRDLDSGLMPLACDSDILRLAKYVGKCKVIEVYLELWLSSLDIAKKSCKNSKVTFDESPVEIDMSQEFDPFFSSLELTESAEPRVDKEIGQSSGNKNNEDEDEDSGFGELDENPIDDVEVNMDEFRDKIDKIVESVGGSEADVGSDVEVDHDYFDSATDEEGDLEVERNKALRKISKKERSHAGMSSEWKFFVGKKIANKELIKEMVSKLAVEERRQLHIDRNDKKRVRVICRGKTPVFSESNEASGPVNNTSEPSGPVKKIKDASGSDNGPVIDNKQGCPWVLWISKGPHDNSWIVKTYNPTHKCLQTREVKKCTASFLSKDVEESIVPNPKIPTLAVREQLQKKYHLGVSKMKAYRAKKLAKDKIFGNYAQQYTQLKTYALELQKSNPETTVKLED
ncbi:transposase, MuDR [Artemisia annua]|uniref:Transposase, MuDR n=1 Tax=Artemisia annua TaxID=35608 RepID=A0A2U1KN51_ARTAN|nr:transposase, MuDR [Artemisia annua]